MRFLVYFNHLLLFANFCDAFNSAVNIHFRQVYYASPLKWRHTRSIVGPAAIRTLVHSTPTDGIYEVRHSYVEGATFDDRFAEIEAMGGGM